MTAGGNEPDGRMEPEMTDQEIVRAMAENVMGWEFRENGFTERISPGQFYEKWGFLYRHTQEGDDGRYDRRWNPLTSDADSCAVLDRIAADYLVSLYRGDGQRWALCVFRSDIHFVAHEDTNRRRAIAIAALKTVGAWEVDECERAEREAQQNPVEVFYGEPSSAE